MSTPAIAPVAARHMPAERLFHPVELGRYELPHRMVMAPLTRSRARQPGNVPSPLNACYYAQRVSAALIVSEATQVSQQGQGYAWTPGIHSPEQVEGWRGVTEAVHQAGGLIFLQIWHVGRISHPCLQPDDVLEKSGAKAARAAFAQVPLAKPEQLADAHAILFGTPTRFGNMCNFLDQTGRAVGAWRLDRQGRYQHREPARRPEPKWRE